MATMNISLPDQMKAWVEAQSKDGRYSNKTPRQIIEEARAQIVGRRA